MSPLVHLGPDHRGVRTTFHLEGFAAASLFFNTSTEMYCLNVYLRDPGAPGGASFLHMEWLDRGDAEDAYTRLTGCQLGRMPMGMEVQA